jgi:hypothetical protein
MTRVRTLSATVLAAALALAAGCGKKDQPTPPGQQPGPGPGGSPEDKEKAAKAEAEKRLKELGVALHKYHDTMGQFPAGVVGPKGELGLSWRVQLLPYLEEGDGPKLYKEFNLKEPWDSEHNKKLIAKMPKVFALPGKAIEGKTHLRSFAGETAFVRLPPVGFVPKGKAPPPPFANLPPGMPVPRHRFVDISDGLSNTLAVAEAPEAVEWTKPDDLPYRGFPTPDRPIPAPKLGGVFDGGFHALMCDGAVHFLPAKLSEKTLSAMISVNGGEVLPEEATEILFPPAVRNPVVPESVPDTLPDAAARKTAVANYQKIVKGVHDYHNKMVHLPVGIVGPELSVGLSWRVAILPYIGEEKLYKQFKLEERWDSDHNKALIEKMPTVFVSPGKTTEKGHTFVRTSYGRGGILPTGITNDRIVVIYPWIKPGQPVPGRELTYILDGAANTILFVEAADAVPWTKPDELYVPWQGDPIRKEPLPAPKLPALGGVFADGFHAVMVDGRVTFYKTGYPARELAKMFGPTDWPITDPFGEPEKIPYSIPRPLPPGNPVPKKGLGKGDLPIPPPK